MVLGGHLGLAVDREDTVAYIVILFQGVIKKTTCPTEKKRCMGNMYQAGWRQNKICFLGFFFRKS